MLSHGFLHGREGRETKKELTAWKNGGDMRLKGSVRQKSKC